jgi:peptide/nickel transport system substrate-binding protein
VWIEVRTAGWSHHRVLLFGLGIAALLAACRSEPAPAPTATPAPAPSATMAVAKPRHPPRLFTATIGDPKTFNPLVATDAASLAAVADVFEGLVRLDPQSGAIEPALAESWQYAPDGSAINFTLRAARWHDGQRLSTADVVFTFDAIYDERVPSPLEPLLLVDGERIRVEAIDERTVRVQPPRPFAPLLNAMTAPIVPRHVLATSQTAGELAQWWGIETPPPALIGTGPYRLHRYEPGVLIHLTRNPDYWMRDESGRALPYLAEQTIRIVATPEAALQRFLAGETDIHTPQPEEVAQLRAAGPARGIVVRELGLDTGMLFVTFNRNPAHYRQAGETNPRLTWFTDPHFLRALAHAIDKQALISQALHGLGHPAVSFLSPSVGQFHNPDLVAYGHDPDTARRLLAEGGYHDGDGDTVIEDRGNHPVEFTLHTNAGNPMREKICATLAHDWSAALGMRVHCKPLDFGLLVEKLDITFDWDAMLTGFTGSVEPHSAAPLLRSSGALHVWHPNQKVPATEWEAEIDALLDRGSRTLDLEARRAAYWRIQEIIIEQLPIIPLVHPLRFTAATAVLENYEPTVWGVHRPERIRFAE